MRTFHRVVLVFAVLLSAFPLFAQRVPFSGVIPIPGVIEAENFDNGGNGLTWFDTTAGNVFGAYRASDMDVGAIPAGGFHIGFLADGEWAEYSVNVATAGTYNVTLKWASDYAGATSFRLLRNGTALTTQTVTKTSQVAGDWHRYLTKVFPVTLPAGPGILRVEFTQGAWNFDSLTFAQQSCAAPVFNGTLPASSTINVPAGFLLNQLKNKVTGAVSYQWYRDGFAVPGQTTDVLNLPNAEQGTDVGNYTLVATSACGATATSNVSRLAQVGCSASPGHNSENIYRALAGQPDYCYWQADKGDNFPYGNTDVSGSYNKPVVSGAVAFIKGVSPYSQWWTDYLTRELGRGPAGANWFYGGNEIGSFTYQHFNEISVLAVAYHANKTGQTGIRDLAWEWLRNTLAIHAAIAAPTNMSTMHVQGQSMAGINYTGPYIAMAGERSNWINWAGSDRSIFFSQAVGGLTHNLQGETSGVQHTRQFIEANFAGASPNAYGLTTAQRDALRNIVLTGTLPTGFLGNYISTSLRTKTRYHIVAWQSPEVVRLTLMEKSNHTETAPTFGAVYYTNARAAGGKEVHLLWPWSGVFVNDNYKDGVVKGIGTLNLPARSFEAQQPVPGQPPSPVHPPMLVTINGLPQATPAYWIVLSPTAPAVKQ